MTEPDGQNEQQRQQAVRLTVAKDGSGDYDTVDTALEALGGKEGPPSCVFIKEGVYRERLEIRRPGIILEGQSVGSTVITGGLSVGMITGDNSKRGIFQTYNMLVDIYDFTAKNLTIENNAGPGEVVGQALVLYADGDRALLKGYRLLGGQGTLFTGPPPPEEMQKSGFIGPRQLSPRINGHHCCQDYSIRGDIDFTLGSATAYFDRCELYPVGRDTGKKGHVTAASTPKEQKYRYVFRNCRSTGNSSRKSVYLGRSRKDYIGMVLVDCHLRPRICREGWYDWDKENARSILFYGEYGSYGPGAEEQETMEQGKGDHCTSRPDRVFMLTREQIQDYTMEQVLDGTNGWSPGVYI